jgi:hypothetical protein
LIAALLAATLEVSSPTSATLISVGDGALVYDDDRNAFLGWRMPIRRLTKASVFPALLLMVA